MKPKRNAKKLLGITRSQAKMFEYSIPEESHIDISAYDPSKLYTLTLGLIGDLSYYVIEENNEKIELAKKNLNFSAHFFDALLQSKLRVENNDYLKLLGASSYYLCDLPGSAKVLLESIDFENLDLDSENIDKALYCVLKNDFFQFNDEREYSSKLNEILHAYQLFLDTGDIENTFELLQILRKYIYLNGSDRELLFIDILYAVIKIKYKNSSWIALPEYSGLERELWHDVISKDNFIKELWPAQHLLGEKNIYKGKSAVVQMPTSAGKTKSTELIIRSSFLSERAKLAVIVAPFRALCNEIKNDLSIAFNGETVEVNEFSDVLQVDEDNDIVELLDDQKEVTINTILVATPEKLYFILKQFPELANKIGLLIYDEGHQFDTGARGVTYELLLASLKTLVDAHIQTILISAVIGNSSEINDWLNPNGGVVVEGSTLTPTYRTVAFTTWLHTLGQVKFVNPSNPDNEEYFVPKVIKSQNLELRGRERNPRVFPKKNDPNTIALYLGLKLSNQGSVAIFSGRKSSVISMCTEIVDAYDRNLTTNKPLLYSNELEINKLATLYKKHFGTESKQAKAVEYGILTHHGNLPQGIKLSVEYALQHSLAKFVICTSTLAQGVNLPIKYLIITSVYQGQERLKVRDFHNLIGRAGRAGKYTEGSIIFANNTLYDNRRNERWKWDGTKELLNPSNSEDSSSSILTIFNPIYDAQGRLIQELTLDQLLTLLNNPEIDDIENQHLKQQIVWKKTILDSIESYILANSEINLHSIVENTLAYHSIDDSEKEKLIQLFEAIQANIIEKVPAEKRTIYAKSLFGIDDIKFYEDWLSEHYYALLQIADTEELLVYLWNIITIKIKNNTFKKFTPNDLLISVSSNWILGKSYKEILNNTNNAKIGTRNLTIEHIIDLCEQALSFDATMIMSTLIELIELYEDSEEKEDLKTKLKFLQKQLKYGLNTSSQIIMYELGFNDRVIAQELSENICRTDDCSFRKIKRKISRNQNTVEEVLNEYPTYFTEIYRNLDLRLESTTKPSTEQQV